MKSRKVAGKPAAAKKVTAKKAAPKPAASAGRSRGRSGSSPVGGAAAAQPQPYYGVEMKSIGGRWVQMHPDSE
ncbi:MULTISPECIES: hypothetical protein [unclassified Streptomyces]|uniref:hypothetical protein n=1 Tax=unclassified Streptomyces TaxID=2593676 RepID=UPI0012FEB24D|nr:MULTISPECIES: hypothetical protein [unclassified Streptomyces]